MRRFHSTRSFLLRVIITGLVLADIAHGQTPAAVDSGVVSQVCTGLLPIAVSPPPGGFLTGCAYIYSLPWLVSNLGGPSFGALWYPSCDAGVCAGYPPSGTATLRCLIANGYGCCVSVGQAYLVGTATLQGQVLQGLSQRWDSDSDQRVGICFTMYAGNGMRVLSVPITTPPAGGSQVQVVGFATALMTYRPSNAPLYLEFLPTGVVRAASAGWGRLRTLYR